MRVGGAHRRYRVAVADANPGTPCGEILLDTTQYGSGAARAGTALRAVMAPSRLEAPGGGLSHASCVGDTSHDREWPSRGGPAAEE